jgi:hypothetical protein
MRDVDPASPVAASSGFGTANAVWTCASDSRSYLSGSKLLLNVRYWHKADVQTALMKSAIGGKADMTRTGRDVR